jgi:alpha-tubulin suppressor-like RCC1 family protein
MGDDMNICFWVRLCPSIESTSDDIGELREIDKQYEKHTSFCYYRRYPISPEICEELDLAGFADSTTGDEKAHEFDATDKTLSVEKTKHMPGAILPPPKKPMQHEIFVAMLVRNSSEIDSQTQEDMDDIAFSVENEFEEGISNSIMYETEAMSGVDSPRKANIKSRLGQAQASGEGGGSASGNGTGKMDRLQISDVTSSWTSNSSPFAEIYGWGRNTAYLFDKNKEKIADRGASMLTPDADKQMEDHDTNYVCFNPTAISIPPSIHLERIRMIACSPTHMLVLTYNGSVYSCGDNTEGALGLGDTKNRQSLDLVLWPTLARENLDEEDADAKAKVDKQRNVVCISAGAAAIGSHSMAITESGDLYGWGVAYASGHGTAKKSITSPQKIFMPQPQEVINALREKAKAEKEAVRRAGGDVVTEEPELPDEEMTAAEIELRRSREIEAAGSAPVKHVACGGGFTVAVLECGYVASWGMWSHGRLGLGPPPKIEGETKKSRGRNKKKVVRYQLRPRLIPALKHVVKVSV